MQVQHGQSQEKMIEALQHQVDELAAVNRLLQDKLEYQEQTQEKMLQEQQHQQHQMEEITTANHLLQDQLERKEQFTAMIAHELRGPLTPIINYAQMLSRHNCETKKQNKEARSLQNKKLQRHTNIIISQARRLTRLVEDLLDASRLASEQFTLLCTECDIVALAQEIVEQLRPVAPYHSFTVDVPTTPVIGYWDAGRLQQAFGNLLDNAIKYSDEGTTITLRIWTTQDRVHASVNNQGVSIPPTDIGQLFRPYTRLQATSGARHVARQGTGLGLYITKSIIEAHQGTLRLEPQTEETQGQKGGTTFSFTLPLTNSSRD